jgi:hypothetical protein
MKCVGPPVLVRRIESLWVGRDREQLNAMFDFYAPLAELETGRRRLLQFSTEVGCLGRARSWVRH